MKLPNVILVLLCIFLTSTSEAKLTFAKAPFEYSYGNSTFKWENKLRLDGFYSKNARLLNDENGGLDKVVIPGRFILDSGLHHYFRNEHCEWDALHIKTGIRFKGTFGAPFSTLRTAPATIKDLDLAVIGSHFHPLEIHIPIVREIWGEFLLNDMFNIDFANHHYFTMGLFPFALGRGISLGDAYALAPDFIGYDPANAVDQYAPGFKLSGTLIKDHWLDYDLYGEIEDNFAESFNSVNLKTQGQFYGHRFFPARGFGVINYIFAGRLKWTPVNDGCHSLYFEPYALYNNENTQKVEVAGDASSQLGTFGLAGEFKRGDFEVGFELAHNIGKQHVKGLDRNVVLKELRVTNSLNELGNISVPVFVNSHVVLVGNPAVKVPFDVSKNLQKAIDAPIKGVSCNGCLEYLNGQTYQGVGLPDAQSQTELLVRNASDRFRDPYTNEFCGTMFTADAAYRLRSNLRIAGSVGYATGDENPNKDLDELGESSVDGTYCGFIGLQENYSGKRVRSGFVMSGAGKIPRLLSYPVSTPFNPDVAVPTNEFPTAIYSHFTNLAFVGGAIWYEYEACASRWEINPNILTFWQPYPPRFFDKVAGVSVERRADRHLGTELNIYVDGFVAPGLRLFLVSGVFISGQYYDDVAGHPLSRAEKKYLDSVDGTGEAVDFTPTLGNDNAFFINAGIEYRF